MSRLALAAGLLLFAPLAWAQTGEDGGAGDDAGVVDAGTAGDGGSQGEGGADRDNPEGNDSTGRVVTVCNFSYECTRGFTCQDGRCTWTRYRDATGGFCGGVSGVLLLGGVFALTRRRPSR
ncbi:MAG: hypothetical protein M3Y59_07785 [Myxococcota bacterium]|nr:hypothetical protein [Myxococcota bacterium]